MKNSSTNSLNQTNNKSSFMTMLSKESSGAEQKYGFPRPTRMTVFEREIALRDGAEIAQIPEQIFSAQFIMQQAAEGYFELINSASESMQSMFTESNMVIILNANCGPVWQWHANKTVAGMVADANGIEELSQLPDDSELKSLIHRLALLTPVQNAALVDVCERYWRNKHVGALEESFEKMNFILA